MALSFSSPHVQVRLTLRIGGLLLLITLLGACRTPSAPVRPKALPYQFKPVQEMSPFVPADLDGNGTDEKLRRVSTQSTGPSQPSSPTKNALLLETQSGKVIEQVNYAHPIQRPHPLDVTGDGTLEIIVPFVRSDSLFFSIVTADGTKRNQLYVTKGEPRQEPDGTLPWDPVVRDVFWTDTDGNGTRELLTLVQTYYARLPRGVWIHDLPSGRLLGKCVVGAPLDWWELGDFDDDPHQELLVAAGAPNNGAQAGGMSDRYTYLYAFDLGHPPSVQWKREMGSPFLRARFRSGDFDGNGVREYVGYTTSERGRSQPARFQILDPGTGRIRQQQSYPYTSESAVVADLDDDERDELLVLDKSGVLHQLGRNLMEEARAQFGPQTAKIWRIPDVTGEGRAEVFLSRADRTLALGPNLTILAAMPEAGAWHTVRRGSGQPPYLYGERDGQALLYRLMPNRDWWLYRYGPWGLGLLAVGLIGGLAIWGHRAYRRHRALRRERVDLTEVQDGAHLLVRADGSVEHADEAARSLLGISDPCPDAALLAQEVPGISAVLEEIREGEAEEGSRAVEVPVPGGDSSTETVRVRLKALGDGHPHTWLLRLSDTGTSETRNGPSYRTWNLMARRVAHDLKNPLTSILLLVERLRETTQEHAPALADEVGDYAERVEHRVQSLRRMTTNFMKFVGEEEPSLVRADLQAFVEECVRELRKDLPTDIELALETDAELPAAAFDRDQIHSVLENLVANAMEALPEGGTITVSLRMERGLQRHPTEEPHDYLALEVRDTGVGMGPETQARLFDPGYTTSEEGAGLGLVIAKKVAEDHGGHLEVESEEGIGTAVTVHLPVAGEPAQKEPASEER